MRRHRAAVLGLILFAWLACASPLFARVVAGAEHFGEPSQQDTGEPEPEEPPGELDSNQDEDASGEGSTSKPPAETPPDGDREEGAPKQTDGEQGAAGRDAPNWDELVPLIVRSILAIAFFLLFLFFLKCFFDEARESKTLAYTSHWGGFGGGTNGWEVSKALVYLIAAALFGLLASALVVAPSVGAD